MTSPKDKSWTNPMDIMKKTQRFRASRRLSRSQSLNLSRRISNPMSNENVPSDSTKSSEGSLKRRNPFLCEQPAAKHLIGFNHSHSFSANNSHDKKLASADFFQEYSHEKVQDTKDIVQNIGKSLRSIQDTVSECKLKEVNVKDKTNLEQNASSVDTHIFDKSDLDAEDKRTSHCKPVLDWSLKTKMRVVTDDLKKDNGKFPGIDAKHLDAFVRNQFEIHDWQNLDVYQKIRRCCFHYSFPCMPWLSTFPRLAPHFKSRVKALLSVYQQLRGGLCPYFYVCTHQFTVLFRCLRSESSCSLSVLLSPSTRGLRELLKKEGISFQLPNLKKEALLRTGTGGQNDLNTKSTRPVQSGSSADVGGTGYCSNDEDLFDDDDDDDDKHSSNKQTQPCGEGTTKEDDNGDGLNEPKETGGQNEDNDDDDDDDDDGNLAFEWLEDMGLNKQDFPSLKPHNVKMQRENFHEIDNRSQSMVYMQGLQVHAFFNFLQNFSGCIASSGPQYGLPPTILSPKPFEGGTLVSNSVKQSILQGQSHHQRGVKLQTPSDCGDGFSSKPSCTRVMEISGPILPHHALNISAVLKSTKSNSSMSYSIHQPSTAFNIDSSSEVSDEEQLNIMNTGLSKLLVPYSPKISGLMTEVEDVMVSGVIKSVRDATVSHQGFTYD